MTSISSNAGFVPTFGSIFAETSRKAISTSKKARARSSFPDILRSAIMQIRELHEMDSDSDFQAPSLSTMSKMLVDLMAIREGSPSLWPACLVPGADGSLQAEWDTRDLEILYLIDSNGHRSIYVEDRVANIEYEAEGDAALTLATRETHRMVSRQVTPSFEALLDKELPCGSAASIRLELA